MLGREPYPREIDYARLAAETPHLVLSRTLDRHEWPTARIAATSTTRRLPRQPGNPVYVVGGPGLVAGLIDAGLLDELRLIVHPVALGGGRALFEAPSGRRSSRGRRTDGGRPPQPRLPARCVR